MKSIEEQLVEWGGERLIVQHDPLTGAWVIIALHSSRMGPPTGGTRMRAYPSLSVAIEDALGLSKGMTHKYAVAGFPRGGGKAVLSCPRPLEGSERRGLLRRYGQLIADLGGLFYTGPDVGTSPEDMDVIAETAESFVFARTTAGGGAGSSGPLTALGVFAGLEAACAEVFVDKGLRDRTVLVQGLGSVGSTLVRLLLDANAEVWVTDVSEAALAPYRDAEGVTIVDADEALTTHCDVFSPNALGGVIDVEAAQSIRCRVVVGGANNQLATPAAGAVLHARGILYVPDFVVNVGGAMGITGIEALGWTKEEAASRVRTGVAEGVRRTLQVMESEGLLPEAAARSVAASRLHEH